MEALTPSLTEYDKRVLAAVPACGEKEWFGREGTELSSVWEMAEAMDDLDVKGLWVELLALEHVGYVTQARSKSRGRVVWWRTRRGDEALDA
jgi:hypothetical protein